MKNSVERLTAAAIIRDGKTHTGSRSHYELRQMLGDISPTASNMNDAEGFVTNFGRFVTRREAVEVGIAAGQLGPRWRTTGRPLLSSDVEWDAPKPPPPNK